MGLVVLVQPETNILDRGKSRPTPPISLLCAARLAARNHEIRIVDLRRNSAWKNALRDFMRRKPLLFGVTSITGNQLLSAAAVARFLEMECETPVVWGGIHGTLFPDQVLDGATPTAVIRHEGEETLRELADRLERGEPWEDMAGISFRRDGRNVHNADRDFVNLDDMPDIPFELAGKEPWFLMQGRPTLYIETSRGCPSACTYCYNVAYHKRCWRGQSAECVLDMLDRLRARLLRVTHLSIVDDDFFGRRERTEALLDGLIKRGAPFTYQVQGAHIGYVGKMSDEDFSRLRRSGCVRLDMGAESGSAELLEKLRKITTPESVLDINAKCRRAGITPWFNFMIGTPQETPADLEKTLDLGLRIIDENPDALLSPFFLYAPYPGTELFRTAQEMGFSAPATLEDWRGLHSGERSSPWISKARRKTLQAIYFLSIFIDGKLDVYDTHPLIRLAARLYRPFARWRMRRRFFAGMPEKALFMALFDIG